jgi:hypothetical protein
MAWLKGHVLSTGDQSLPTAAGEAELLLSP